MKKSTRPKNTKLCTFLLELNTLRISGVSEGNTKKAYGNYFLYLYRNMQNRRYDWRKYWLRIMSVGVEMQSAPSLGRPRATRDHCLPLDFYRVLQYPSHGLSGDFGLVASNFNVCWSYVTINMTIFAETEKKTPEPKEFPHFISVGTEECRNRSAWPSHTYDWFTYANGGNCPWSKSDDLYSTGSSPELLSALSAAKTHVQLHDNRFVNSPQQKPFEVRHNILEELQFWRF